MSDADASVWVVFNREIYNFPELLSGYLVELGNMSRLANAMKELLTDPVKRKQLGVNGRNRLKRNILATVIYRHYSDSSTKPLMTMK
jgi:hypothetical protein